MNVYLPKELPLIAGLAIRDSAAALCGNPDIGLKWPNDVVCDGRKLAGLLCERVSNVDLIGVGLNVNVDPATAPPPLENRIASLKCILGKPLDMTEVAISLAESMHRVLRRRMEQPFSAFVRAYADHDALAGKRVTVIASENQSPISGRCEGVDQTGRLMVRHRGTLHRVVSGHVVLNKPTARIT